MLKITPAAWSIGNSKSGETIAPTAASSARLCASVVEGGVAVKAIAAGSRVRVQMHVNRWWDEKFRV